MSRNNGETCIAGTAPMIIKVPLTASPLCTAVIASPFVTVAMMTFAPPSFCSSFAASVASESM